MHGLKTHATRRSGQTHEDEPMSLSKKDSLLVAQARNFSAVLSADPGVYGASATTAAEVVAGVDAYTGAVGALVEARANGVRSEQMTADRSTTRRAMLNLLRPIYAAVQASTSISDADKIALGVHVIAKRRTREAVPAFAPLLSVTRVDGSVVSLRISDPREPNRKARPAHTEGISIFTFVGDQPPADRSAFVFEANTGRTSIDVAFDGSVPIGTTVWFVASFFNNRKESGPTCMPIRATLGAGAILPMRLAA
jgi:hypothetical protein